MNWRPKPESTADGSPFSGSIIGVLLPVQSEIPEDFIRSWHYRDHPWCGVVNNWFFKGINKSDFKPKEGINADEAWLHLGRCMHSFEPKHEHKIAGVAWLMSQWFNKA